MDTISRRGILHGDAHTIANDNCIGDLLDGIKAEERPVVPGWGFNVAIGRGNPKS